MLFVNKVVINNVHCAEYSKKRRSPLKRVISEVYFNVNYRKMKKKLIETWSGQNREMLRRLCSRQRNSTLIQWCHYDKMQRGMLSHRVAKDGNRSESIWEWNLQKLQTDWCNNRGRHGVNAKASIGATSRSSTSFGPPSSDGSLKNSGPFVKLLSVFIFRKRTAIVRRQNSNKLGKSGSEQEAWIEWLYIWRLPIDMKRDIR